MIINAKLVEPEILTFSIQIISEFYKNVYYKKELSA